MKSQHGPRSLSRTPRPPRAPREAWITDPHALLAALESVTRAKEPASAHAAPESPRHGPVLVAPLAARDDEPPSAPSLRDDERIGRASSAGAVVIIRRRRAA